MAKRGRKRKGSDVVGIAIDLSIPVMDKLEVRAKIAKRSKRSEAALIIEEAVEASGKNGKKD